MSKPRPETGRLLTLAEAKNIATPCVYALCDTSGGSFYVGRSIRPGRRFREHSWPCNRKNLALRARIASLGHSLRIVILSLNVEDERAEIAKRPWLLNLVGPHHWAWEQQKNRPWVAGTGMVVPSRAALCRMSGPKAAVCRRWLGSLSPAERCAVEIELFRELPFYIQKRCEPWIARNKDRMLRCLEEAHGHRA